MEETRIQKPSNRRDFSALYKGVCNMLGCDMDWTGGLSQLLSGEILIAGKDEVGWRRDPNACQPK